jgi:hypothetical protein
MIFKDDFYEHEGRIAAIVGKDSNTDRMLLFDNISVLSTFDGLFALTRIYGSPTLIEGMPL